MCYTGAMLKVAVMLNNYFHDLATALLMTSGFAAFYLAKAVEKAKTKEAVNLFAQLFQRFTVIGRIAFVWIIVAGAIRLVAFNTYEWQDAVGKEQVPALIFKHLLLFAVVGAGIYAWRRVSKKVAVIKESVSQKVVKSGKIIKLRQTPVNR
jgi:signal transduction histidine kinase